MNSENSNSTNEFINLMKRLRKLGLDAYTLKDNSISAAQMTLLDWISTSPGCGVQDIANALKQTAPTISVGVRKLEKSKLVERKPNPMDRRSVQFFLTHKGDALQMQIQRCHHRKFQLLLSGLIPQEQERLLKLLEKAILSAESKFSKNEVKDIQAVRHPLQALEEID
jgi:DNA-binding MarR family transcriptional regulator